MENLVTLMSHSDGWLFIPSAVALGALHGLEPGHSKTMMAAFIVAIRGTVAQAIMLGISATLSHTAVVWIVAMLGLSYGQDWDSAATEPYLKLVSAILMIGVALWMIWRNYRNHHEHDHGHNHNHDHFYEDAHSRQHAAEIKKHFAGKHITTGQIILFGLTGGLIPCPAAITVLLLCLQLKEITLGAGLVLCFSIGLAATLVASGVIAAWGTRHASKAAAGRWPILDSLASRAPYFSSAAIILIGLYIGWQGLQELI